MNFALMSKRPFMQEQYAAYMDQFVSESCLDLDFTIYQDPQSLLQAVNEAPVDILLYDFEEDEDFFSTVRRIVESTATCQLVLVGDDVRNAILGYALKAKDYLVTPIDQEDFLEVVSRLIRESMERIQQVIPLKVGGQWGSLPTHRITHVESLGHYMTFHMDDGEQFKTLGKHQDFSRHWQSNFNFIRVHQSYVVNLAHVETVDSKAITLSDGAQIPVSRSYLGQTKRALSLYQLQRYHAEPSAHSAKAPHVTKSEPTKGGMQR